MRLKNKEELDKIISYQFDLNNPLGIIAYIALVLFVAWLLSRCIRYVIVLIINSKQTDRFGRTSIQFLRNSVKFFVGIFALVFIVMSIPSLRSKATLIFSGAGIIAAIIGFAAQAALSNLIAGAFIVIFKPFRVGDYIKLDDTRVGIVEDITLRHTVINNFENKRLIIPNSVISTDSVLNHTIQDSNVLSFNNFKIGLRADIDLARAIIQEEAIKLPMVMETDVSTIDVRVIDIHESYIHIRAYVWMNEPFQEFRGKCALKEAVHKRFIQEGVDLPIPINKVERIE
ncbi:Potassium efflux system KefA protein [Tenacibaculum sp. 190524A05c]|uniref:Potassium efflux system KefA protein n=1 Tax=Tenacibaculum platacis TaxID=3137852 RepID=A0ABM9P0H0_9FLAO